MEGEVGIAAGRHPGAGKTELSALLYGRAHPLGYDQILVLEELERRVERLELQRNWAAGRRMPPVVETGGIYSIAFGTVDGGYVLSRMTSVGLMMIRLPTSRWLNTSFTRFAITLAIVLA